METKKNSKFHYAWVIMFCGCCIVGIQLGVFAYTIGNFYLPVSQTLGVGVGDIALYQTMQAFASALTFPSITETPSLSRKSTMASAPFRTPRCAMTALSTNGATRISP